MRALNIIGSEVSVTTANAVSSAILVRTVVSLANGASVATIKDSGGTTLGTTTIIPYVETYIRKASTDTITSGTGTLLCTPVSFFD